MIKQPIEKMYKFCLCIFSLLKICSASYIDVLFPKILEIYKVGNNIVLVMLVVTFFANMLTEVNVKRILLKKIWVLLVMVIMIFLISLNYVDTEFVIFFLFIIAQPKIMDTKKMAKAIAIANAIAIATVVGGFVVGLLPEYIVEQHGKIRHSLGFVSSNACSNAVTVTLLNYVYYRGKKWNIWDSIICCCIVLTFTEFTDSRVSLILALVIVIVISNIKWLYNANMIKKVIYGVGKYIFPILLIGSISITIYFYNHINTQLFRTVNDIATGRLYEMVSFYDKYGIHLLGERLTTVGIREATEKGMQWIGIDTSYMSYTYRFGLIFITMVAILYILLGHYLQKKDNLVGMIIVILLCIMGMTENVILLVNYNIAILLMGRMLEEKNDNTKDIGDGKKGGILVEEK